jgi:hypothetical protein
MVLLLIDDLNNSKYDCFQSIQNELNKIYSTNITNIKNENEYYKNNFRPLPYPQDEYKRCFCGHGCLIYNIYTLSNENNDKILLTGCDCITKTGIETSGLIENGYERRVEYFKNKNDISKIEYAGGTKLMDFKYYTENYDDDKTTILDDICCDVCKIWRRKAGEKPKEKIEENPEEKTERKINYYFFYNNIESEIFIFCIKCSKSLELIGKYGVCQFCKNPNDDNKKVFIVYLVKMFLIVKVVIKRKGVM